MNHDDFRRIANEELDGVATPADREALRRHLAESDGAREEFESLQEVFTRLKSVGLEESPAGLRQSVLRAVVAQRREQMSVSRSPGWKGFLGGLLRVPDLRGALTFASGVGVGAAAIAIVAGNLVGSRHFESSELTGTMAPPPAESTGRFVESQTLEANGVTLTADTRRTSDGVILRLVASGEGASGAQITAAFDRGELHPVTLRMEPPSAGEFDLDQTGLRISLSGAGVTTLSLHCESAQPAPLGLELRAGGRTTRAKLGTDSSESR